MEKIDMSKSKRIAISSSSVFSVKNKCTSLHWAAMLLNRLACKGEEMVKMSVTVALHTK